MSGHGEKLSRKQEQAIGALLSTHTLRQAAEQVGVAEVTLRRWLGSPAFHRSYQDARQHVLSQTTDQLIHACTGAVATLESIMQDTDCTASARVTAARAILEMAYQGVELDSVAARVTELEAMLRTEQAVAG